ncbi:MAG: NADH:ubiquinone oxidoreductase [Proteobacteria bacterium]|nr:NADH:ubiquinone oxidoreductase [Pseudomonadota bacterium]MBU1586101.1 NADH:ubiquinone oxidoreductase [Pseudomonadota bacterium]MBU2628108.1 NADH:ubiquinone oxidoreductase [Pseudomonadota bacterium]
MEYLGIKIEKPKVAFFDFTCCEGCQLQITNKEDTLIDLLSLVEIVNFREISSDKNNDYDIAFIEGAISRQDQIDRIKKIRKNAKLLISLGTCACSGGVNSLINTHDTKDAVTEVYGKHKIDTLPVKSAKEIVKIDFEIPGCPINKKEFENIVVHLITGADFSFKKYPVCVECKQNLNHCLLDENKICLGPITRAGCNAPCPGGKLPCYGCRGPAEEHNWPALKQTLIEYGFTLEQIQEKTSFFNMLTEVTSNES